MKNIIIFLKFIFAIIFIYEKYLYYSSITSFSDSLVNSENCIFSLDVGLPFAKPIISYNDRLEPNRLAMVLNKFGFYNGIPECNKYKISLYIVYDFLILFCVINSLFFTKTPFLSFILLLDSILNLGSIVYKEFIRPDDQFVSIFTRFFNMFMPFYFNEGSLLEIIKATFNIIVSEEFLRLNNVILNSVIIIYIYLLSLFYNDNNKKDEMNDNYIKN